MSATVGDQVTAGQTLATIDDASLQHDLDSARLELAQAKQTRAEAVEAENADDSSSASGSSGGGSGSNGSGGSGGTSTGGGAVRSA